MVTKMSAQVQVLTFKLDCIRQHIERRMSVVDAVTQSELQYILDMIQRYEHVPASWSLDRPIVRKESAHE